MFHRILPYMLLCYWLKSLKPRPRFSWGRGLGYGALFLTVAMPPVAIAPAYASELTEWRFDPTTRQLELNVPGGTTPNYFLLAQPARIVLDLPNTVVSNPLEEQTYSGMIRSIRVSQFQPTLTRIVIELAPDAVLAPAQVELRQVSPSGSSTPEQWIVRPLLAGDAPVAAIEPIPPTPPPSGVDEAPEEPRGILFEADSNGISDTAESEIEETGDQGVNLFDVLAQASEPDAETVDDDVNPAADQLPPLEPGAFEIPVEIPPPLPEVEDESTSLPVAIAPPPEPPIDSPSGNDSTSNVPPAPPAVTDEQAEGPPAESTSEEEALEEGTVEANGLEEDALAEGPLAEGASRPTVIRTPEDLERVLADALPPGTNITVIDDDDDDDDRPLEDRPDSIGPDRIGNNESGNDEADIIPDDEVFQPESPSLSQASPDSSLREPVPEAPVPQAEQDAINPSGAIAFPSPGSSDEESDGVAPIEPDFLSALPPAQSPVDFPVTVTIPSLDKADELADSSDLETSDSESSDLETFDSETFSTETRSDGADLTLETSQWDIQPDSTRSTSGPGQPNLGQLNPAHLEQVAQAPTALSDALDRPSTPTSPSTSPVARASDAPVNVINFGQPIDGSPSSEASPSSAQQRPVVAPSTLAPSSDRQLVVAARPGAMIPSGTVLRLRYPRLTPTLLRKGIAWQDVLLLEQTLLDATGNVIALEGTPVIGRFEITPQYIRFVTQAIALDDRNIPLQAVSGWVPVPAESTAVLIHPNQIVNVRLAQPFDR